MKVGLSNTAKRQSYGMSAPHSKDAIKNIKEFKELVGISTSQTCRNYEEQVANQRNDSSKGSNRFKNNNNGVPESSSERKKTTEESSCLSQYHPILNEHPHSITTIEQLAMEREVVKAVSKDISQRLYQINQSNKQLQLAANLEQNSHKHSAALTQMLTKEIGERMLKDHAVELENMVAKFAREKFILISTIQSQKEHILDNEKAMLQMEQELQKFKEKDNNNGDIIKVEQPKEEQMGQVEQKEILQQKEQKSLVIQQLQSCNNNNNNNNNENNNENNNQQQKNSDECKKTQLEDNQLTNSQNNKNIAERQQMISISRLSVKGSSSLSSLPTATAVGMIAVDASSASARSQQQQSKQPQSMDISSSSQKIIPNQCSSSLKQLLLAQQQQQYLGVINNKNNLCSSPQKVLELIGQYPGQQIPIEQSKQLSQTVNQQNQDKPIIEVKKSIKVIPQYQKDCLAKLQQIKEQQAEKAANNLKNNLSLEIFERFKKTYQEVNHI